MRAFVVVFSCLIASSVAITLTSTEFDVRRTVPGNFMNGLTFTPNGDLYTTMGTNCCVYPNAANLPIGGTLTTGANGTCSTCSISPGNWVSSQTGRIYSLFGYEIDKTNWQGTRRWKDCGASHGITIDPRDGAVFVSSVNTGKVWRIPNPDTYTGVYNTDCAADLFFDLGALGLKGFDAITIGPDGTFYGAGWGANRFVVVSPWSPTKRQGTLIAAKPTSATQPDGISICVGSGNSFALIAMTTGSISKFNLSGPGGAPTYAETTIAKDVGGYLDFTAVDPKGCIWGSTVTLRAGAQGIYRVTNADGTCGCASAQVPSTGACPNCSQVENVQYSGNADFTQTFQSTSQCLSLHFQ